MGFKQFLRDWLLKGPNEDPRSSARDNNVEQSTWGRTNEILKASPDYSVLETKGVNLKIFYGRGGIAIELINYNARKDEHSTELFILPDDCDLGEELAKILTLHSLGRE